MADKTLAAIIVTSLMAYGCKDFEIKSIRNYSIMQYNHRAIKKVYKRMGGIIIWMLFSGNSICLDR